MEIYYLINDKKYLDNYLLREKLEISKADLQQLMKTFQFPEKEVVSLQNKKLYSMNVLTEFIENLMEKNER